MGVASSISATEFPKQGTWLGRAVKVCFNYDTSKTVMGEIVREDAEAPGVMIIRLEDGRHVLSTECQYSIIHDESVCACGGRMVSDGVMRTSMPPRYAHNCDKCGSFAMLDHCIVNKSELHVCGFGIGVSFAGIGR